MFICSRMLAVLNVHVCSPTCVMALVHSSTCLEGSTRSKGLWPTMPFFHRFLFGFPCPSTHCCGGLYSFGQGNKPNSASSRCVCVCVCVMERANHDDDVCRWQKGMTVCVCVSVCVREGRNVCVCACVRVCIWRRERDRVSVYMHTLGIFVDVGGRRFSFRFCLLLFLKKFANNGRYQFMSTVILVYCSNNRQTQTYLFITFYSNQNDNNNASKLSTDLLPTKANNMKTQWTYQRPWRIEQHKPAPFKTGIFIPFYINSPQFSNMHLKKNLLLNMQITLNFCSLKTNVTRWS